MLVGNVEVEIVSACIASLTLGVMLPLLVKAVAPAEGAVEREVGAVVSGVRPVVKLQVLSTANALPAKSLAPEVTVAV